MKKEKQNTDDFFMINNVEEAFVKLQKAIFAANEIINEFSSTDVPCPHKAVEYGLARNVSKKYEDDPSYYFSWKYYVEYEKLMWLVDILFDYTCIASEHLENILEKDN